MTRAGERLTAALLAFFFAGSTAFADAKIPPRLPALKLAPRPRVEPPMRIVRVTSSDRACQPDCPQWISAEGRIALGAGAAFAKVIADLNGRRLPILVSSSGGSLPDAVAMGRLIREKRLAVAVARTFMANCSDRARDCPDAQGRAIVGGARCASACTLVLAGGVERLVGPTPLVGVHQITLAMPQTEGALHLTRIKKVYEPLVADEQVDAYFKAMGIGDPAMTLLRKTPANGIRWLSLAELQSSRLATLALDVDAPIATSGANGLSARAFDGAPVSDAGLTARGEAPAAGGDLEVTLAYARGGGVVRIALADRNAKTTRALSGWSVTACGESVPFTDGIATIPRDRFCAGARVGGVIATGGSPAATVDLTRLGGAAALIDEACP